MPVEKLGKIPPTFCNFFAIYFVGTTCTKLMLEKVYFALIWGCSNKMRHAAICYHLPAKKADK